MKTRQCPLLFVVLSLVLSSLACGLFSAPGANPTDEAEVPLVESTQEAQPAVEETPEDSSAA